jgi:DNA-binding transcriptional MerR regulator
MGVLAKPRRSAAGYRQYPPESVERVRIVRRALALGFTLAELARILRVRDGGGAPCRQVRALAASKLDQVEHQIAELAALRDHLRRLLADWDDRLGRTPEGARANLLQGLLQETKP